MEASPYVLEVFGESPKTNRESRALPMHSHLEHSHENELIRKAL